MAAGVDLLLDLVRQAAHPDLPPPRLIGLDDWAWRKGQRYGTIIVDLESGRPIDLLPDRLAASVTEWLRDHPGIEIITRDRSGAYAEAADAGAPDAVQVADRFHLITNLRDVLLRSFQHYRSEIEQLLAGDRALPNPTAPAEANCSAPAQCVVQADTPLPPQPTPARVQEQQQCCLTYKLAD
jgi:transposase